MVTSGAAAYMLSQQLVVRAYQAEFDFCLSNDEKLQSDRVRLVEAVAAYAQRSTHAYSYVDAHLEIWESQVGGVEIDIP